jgi:hypothetical protein
MSRKMWKCDFKDCEEIAQWYRICKGELVKVCTKHETQLAKQHYGKRVDFSELDEDDIQYLQRKENHSEYVKKVPFKVDCKIKENTVFMDIKDRKTGEWRSFQIAENNWDMDSFREISKDLEDGKFSQKPSIDEFLEILKRTISK